LFGRDYVLPDDVKILADPALSHRIIVGPAARIKDINPEEIIREIIETVPVPGAQVKN
jgi:MoxR-like ATPase